MGEVAHAGAVEFVFHGEPEQADIAHFAPEIGGEIVVLVDGGGAGRDFGIGEAAHGFAQRVDLLPEFEIQAVIGVAGHRASSGKSSSRYSPAGRLVWAASA